MATFRHFYAPVTPNRLSTIRPLGRQGAAPSRYVITRTGSVAPVGFAGVDRRRDAHDVARRRAGRGEPGTEPGHLRGVRRLDLRGPVRDGTGRSPRGRRLLHRRPGVHA